VNKLREETSTEPKEPKRKKPISGSVNTLLNGEFLTREAVTGHLPFVLWLTFLFVLNISWVYYSENTIRNLSRAKKHLEELQAEYNTVSSQLERKKRQSRVALDIQDLGLKEPLNPPYRIVVEEGYFE
jgi:hypothetical protein